MRISDLLASEVRRADGTLVGRVREVRIVQDGPTIGHLQAAFRVDALLVGKRALAVRLGYHAGNNRSPWLLNALFGRGKHHLVDVLMTDVDSWDDEHHIVTLH